MLEEIEEQPNIIISTNREEITLKHNNIILLGCGSSYNAAVYGQRCFEKIKQFIAKAEYSSEFRYFNKNYNKNISIIGISQSGETQDTIDAINGGDALIITNNKNSFLGREYPTVLLECGQEIAVASTKTFTMSCLRLLEMTTDIDIREYLSSAIKEVIDVKEKIKLFVENVNFNKCIFLGSLFDYPIAMEGALKMKEVAQIPSDSMPSSEMKHGPIALVDENCLAVFIISNWTAQIKSNIDEIKSRGGKVMVISSHNATINNIPSFHKNELIGLAIEPLVANVYLQYLALYKAQHLGLNPDKPRNLAKVCTV